MGARDKRKLDEYLEAIRDIERRIQKAEEQSAKTTMPVMGRPAGIPDLFEDHTHLMSDLMVIAFQTDMRPRTADRQQLVRFAASEGDQTVLSRPVDYLGFYLCEGDRNSGGDRYRDLK